MKNLLAVLFIIHLISCNEEEAINNDSFEPTIGPYGTVVTIKGSNFDPSIGNNEVIFKNAKGVLISVTSTTIVAKVPEGAGTGIVVVKSGGKTFDGPVFEYQLSAVTTTFAGTQGYGFTDGVGSAAKFSGPSGLAFDSFDNLYVCDYYNHAIRKITPEGVVTTIAGNGNPGNDDGNGTSATFVWPTSIVVKPNGELLVGHLYGVRKIDLQANVTTVAGGNIVGFKDGLGSEALFDRVKGMCLDGQGVLFVADNDNNRIRKITPDGNVVTIAGNENEGLQNGSPLVSTFSQPYGIVINDLGELFIAEQGNSIIRKIILSEVTTFAGTGYSAWQDGAFDKAMFNGPKGLLFDNFGNLLVADTHNHSIRSIDSFGNVTTILGSYVFGNKNGVGTQARFNEPADLAMNSKGELYISEFSNVQIRKVIFK